MQLIPFLFAAAALFLVLHFLVLPFARRRLGQARGRRVFAWSGFLALSGFLRGLTLISALTTGVTILAMLYVTSRGGTTVEEVDRNVTAVQGLRRGFTGFGTGWGIFSALVILLGLGIYARLRGRRRLDAAMQKAVDRELEALQRKLDAGELEELPPTKPMRDVLQALAQLEAIRDSGTISEESQKSELEGNIVELQQLLLQLDIQRRIQPQLSQEEAGLPRPQNLRERIQMFFISRGLFASLGRVSRLAFLAGYALLVPSLLGIYSGVTVQGESSLAGRQLVELRDLRVELSVKQSRSDWEQAKVALGAPKRELTGEEEEVVEQFAESVEEAFAGSEIWGDVERALPSARASFRIASLGIRNQILVHASSVSKRSTRSAPSLSKAEGVELTAKERTVLEAYEAPGKQRPLRHSASSYLRDELKEAARRKPSLVQRMRAGLASYQQPVSHRGATSALKRTALSTLFQATDNEVGRAVAKMWETQVNSTLKDVASGKRGDATLRRVEAGEALRPAEFSARHAEVQARFHSELADHPDLKALHEKLEHHPPTLNERNPKKLPQQRKATTAYQDFLARNRRLAQPFRGTDAVSSFRSHFPGQRGADLSSLRGQIAQARVDKMGWKPETRQAWRRRNLNPRASFGRSRSFVRLRGFSRIGGVLIGREPDKNAALDVSTLRWETNDSGLVRLLLTTDQGKEIRTPWQRRNLIYHALTYAADQRPTTVTMVTAEPLLELKILLHPTLLDSPLGYRTIEIDRFVDRFTGDMHRRQEATAEVYAQKALYDWVWASRLLAIDSTALGVDEYIGSLLASARGLRDDPRTRSQAEKGLAKPLADDALLKAKPLYFDAEIVALIERCRSDTSFEAFERRLAAALKLVAAESRGLSEKFASYSNLVNRYNRSTSYTVRAGLERQLNSLKAEIERLQEKQATWFAYPPTFEVWSGVRERDYSLTASDLTHSAEHPVLEFMLQVAFTSEPTFGGTADLEEGESISDDPWTFPSIADEIEKTVRVAVAKPENKDAAAIFRDVAEFTVLQRLFRAAFAGHLGDGFPLPRLVRLLEAVAPEGEEEHYRTPRWNLREGQLEATLKGRLTLGWALAKSALSEQQAKRGQKLVDRATELLDQAIANVTAIEESAQTTRKGLAQGDLLKEAETWQKAWEAHQKKRSDWWARWQEVSTDAEIFLRSVDPAGKAESAKEVLNLVVELTHVLELRESLDVVDDYRWMLESRDLPLPPLP